MHLEKELQLFEILLNIITLIVLFETYEWLSHLRCHCKGFERYDVSNMECHCSIVNNHVTKILISRGVPNTS